MSLIHVFTTGETRLLTGGSECRRWSKVMMITELISPNELSLSYHETVGFYIYPQGLYRSISLQI